MNSGLIHELVLANRILSNEGVLDGLGHVSVRNPDKKTSFLMARAIPPVSVTERDIMELDFEGNVIGGSDGKPVSERFLHASIYKKRDDVNAVFHGHHPSMILLSLLGKKLKPVCHLGTFLYQGVPVFKDFEKGSGMLIDSRDVGEKLANALNRKRAILLWAHGYVVVAENLKRVVAQAIYAVVNAEIQIRLLTFGKNIRGISTSLARETMEKGLFAESPLSRVWDHWVHRLHERR
ncbi:MAG: class II aldolase/adducin family protein [Deltaproteobacteria bacterium]|nr:class II aldolase/adducin family protein [Deltaproteobacteria bacterium]